MTFNSPIGLIFHQTHDNPLGELPHEALIFEKISGNSVVLSKTRSYRPFGGFRDGHTRRSYVSPMEDRSPKDLNGPKIPHWPSPIFVYDPMSVNDGWSGLAQAFWMKSLFFLYCRTKGVCAFSDNAFRETFVLLKFNDRPEIVPEGPHGLFPVFITQNLPMMAGSDWQTP